MRVQIHVWLKQSPIYAMNGACWGLIACTCGRCKQRPHNQCMAPLATPLATNARGRKNREVRSGVHNSRNPPQRGTNTIRYSYLKLKTNNSNQGDPSHVPETHTR
jgi:hypothetical protein